MMNEAVAVVRVGVATILLIAFAGKVIGGPAKFASVLAQYRVFPPRLVSVIAWAAIVAEPVVAVAVLVSASPISLVAASCMFSAFALVTTVAHHRDRSAECGCLGAGVRVNMTSTASIANAGVASSAMASAAVMLISHTTDGAMGMITAMSGAGLGALYWLFLFAASVTQSVERARS